MIKFYRLIASGLGSGYLPRVPGTWGSLAYIGVWAVWTHLLSLNESLLILLVAAVGFISVAKVLAAEPTPEGKKNDPGFVVIDEWLGMALALWSLPLDNWWVVPAAFFLFRVLDVLKPGPIRKIEKIPGAIGVMGDDMLAGVIVNFLLKAFL